jgi:hypothetical protein
VWVGHSCPTLLVLVLISTAAETCAFYPNGSGQECPLFTRYLPNPAATRSPEPWRHGWAKRSLLYLFDLFLGVFSLTLVFHMP